MSSIELLLPAKDLQCGKIAINHGADAVYIGASAFGARQAATNSLEDLEELVRYAHLFGAKVHVTLNTLLHDDELEPARKLLWDIYNIGVDAVLIQDLGLLKCDIPPVSLHASTQCHNHSVERVQFLEKLGFTRAVLARETDLHTIQNIRNHTDIELEAFIHGALCVSYSGQCYISQLMTGRSGNRGACAQICRTKFDLQDAEGSTLVRDKHLLSLKDMCRADFIEDMMDAGVMSFKIEGRLKNENYVKNVTAFYRKQIDSILERRPGWEKSSSGTVVFFFQPNINKTFNRNFTSYFIDGKREKMASFNTPKAIGEYLGKLRKERNSYIYVGDAQIINGDGLCFINENLELEGFLVNNVDGNKITPQKELSDFTEVELYRNIDKSFERILNGKTAERRIPVDMSFSADANSCKLTVTDNEGCSVVINENTDLEVAKQPQMVVDNINKALEKLGGTPFVADKIEIDCNYFVHSNILNRMKGLAVDELIEKRVEKNHPTDNVRKYSPKPLFREADYRRNIINKKHRAVYEDFGAEDIEYGIDATNDFADKKLMTCKYCVRYEMGWCRREKGRPYPAMPLYLSNHKHRFKLDFDCRECVMMLELDSKSQK